MRSRVIDAVNASAAELADKCVSPVLRRLSRRASWWPLGHFPIRSGASVNSVRIADRLVHLSLPDEEASEQQWELNHLYIDDPYRLSDLPRTLATVLDIGGNVGLFAILARHYFAQARIHTYEPSPKICGLLRHNTQGLGIEVFESGVSAADGRAEIIDNGLSLYNQVGASPNGSIQLTSIRSAMDRLGPTVDLLKLDCEGAEWSIMSDRACLRRAKHIAMEWHLGGADSLELHELVRLLKEEGFAIESLRESVNRVVGQLTAVNLRLRDAEDAEK